jgi:hypothetical protein
MNALFPFHGGRRAMAACDGDARRTKQSGAGGNGPFSERDLDDALLGFTPPWRHQGNTHHQPIYKIISAPSHLH